MLTNGTPNTAVCCCSKHVPPCDLTKERRRNEDYRWELTPFKFLRPSAKCASVCVVKGDNNARTGSRHRFCQGRVKRHDIMCGADEIEVARKVALRQVETRIPRISFPCGHDVVVCQDEHGLIGQACTSGPCNTRANQRSFCKALQPGIHACTMQ